MSGEMSGNVVIYFVYLFYVNALKQTTIHTLYIKFLGFYTPDIGSQNTFITFVAS